MNDSKMYTEQRRMDILQRIRQNGSVSVAELTEQFHVSGTTIRLDLTALEKTGEIARTHGGAVLSTLIVREPTISERAHHDEKARIAARAIEHIRNNDVLLIDTGTTTLALARSLARSALSSLTVYTNDLDILRALEEKENWDLYMLGGKIRNGFHYAYGSQTMEELKRYQFRKLFLATSALSLRDGLTTAHSELAALKAAMIAASDEVILLADASKLHRVDFQRFANLSAIDVLIMDKGIGESDARALKMQIGHCELV